MNFQSKRTSLIILGISSLVLSRAMYFFFDDPEGPNLLVVTVTAGVVFSLSLVSYLLNLSSLKRLFLAIALQIIIVTALYFALS